MPNITGITGATVRNVDPYGVFYKLGDGAILGAGAYGTFTNDFDASRVSSAYKSNAHVRPLSITTAFLIKY